MAKLVHRPEAVLRRERRLNGLPQGDDVDSPPGRWWVRLLTSRTLWWTLLLAVFLAATLAYQYVVIAGQLFSRLDDANLVAGLSLGVLAALVPVALARVATRRFRLRSTENLTLVAAWAWWLAGVVGVSVALWRMLRARPLVGGWALDGPLLWGTVGGLLMTAILLGLTLASVKDDPSDGGRGAWHWVALGLGIAGLLGLAAWLWWASTRMGSLPTRDEVLGAAGAGAHLPTLHDVNKIIGESAGYAGRTLAVYVVIFVLLVDRRRPSGWLAWLSALAWGAGASTLLSIVINTWAGQLLGSGSDDAGASNMRTAVYIAPFVEEAAKVTVVFLLIALLRHRVTNKLNVVALTGLTAVGFAFTENIIYFMRAKLYASQEIGAGDADAAMAELAFLRGVVTSWGHPMFSIMTGMGLALGMKQRSRVARVLYPLAGYCVAAGLHMAFNLMASVSQDQGQVIRTFMFMGAGVVVTLLGFLVTNWMRENRLVATRLGDYQQMGWLRDRDPIVFASFRRRFALVLLSLLIGVQTWWATVRLIRAMTDLAYLRDQLTRGLVDAVGLQRERDLLARIRQLRRRGLSDVRGWRQFPYFWRSPWRWRRGAWSAPVGQLASDAPTAGRQYSAVDPSWAPPS